MNITTSHQALEVIKSNSNVFIHTGSAIPQHLIHAMTMRAKELSNVSIYQLHTEGEAPYAKEEMASAFTIKALFVGPSTRNGYPK